MIVSVSQCNAAPVCGSCCLFAPSRSRSSPWTTRVVDFSADNLGGIEPFLSRKPMPFTSFCRFFSRTCLSVTVQCHAVHVQRAPRVATFRKLSCRQGTTGPYYSQPTRVPSNWAAFSGPSHSFCPRAAPSHGSERCCSKVLSWLPTWHNGSLAGFLAPFNPVGVGRNAMQGNPWVWVGGRYAQPRCPHYHRR